MGRSEHFTSRLTCPWFGNSPQRSAALRLCGGSAALPRAASLLSPEDLTAVAASYGVAEEQVRRDHLIGHTLAAIAAASADVVFFGGTALARTHLADPASGGRLSEDIDLWSESRRETAQLLEKAIPRALRREFPGVEFTVGLSAVRAVDPAQLATPDGLRLRVQLLDADGGHAHWRMWPTEARLLAPRYSDVQATRLVVPTLPAFVAMKLTAWLDRRAARDLFDLASLARLGAVSTESLELAEAALGYRPSAAMLRLEPQGDWIIELSNQISDPGTAQACLADVMAAINDLRVA
jgi:predicted nucleotidyltransferase component of viral defense system